MKAQTAVVIVSHSKALAQGVRELAGQMARSADLVWAIGGTDEGEIGTSAPGIYALLGRALDAAENAVVLMDLGSAHLNTVMAIEMLEPALQGRVLLADAPIVEGAVLAVVAAASGDDAPTVVQRAEEARAMRKLA